MTWNPLVPFASTNAVGHSPRAQQLIYLTFKESLDGSATPENGRFIRRSEDEAAPHITGLQRDRHRL